MANFDKANSTQGYFWRANFWNNAGSPTPTPDTIGRRVAAYIPSGKVAVSAPTSGKVVVQI